MRRVIMLAFVALGLCFVAGMLIGTAMIAVRS